MLDVLLIDPPDLARSCYQYNTRRIGNAIPKLGLLYLISALRKHRITVELLDAFILQLSLEQVLAAVQSARPRVIGISANSFQIQDAVRIARSIRSRLGPGIPIVLGGPHISADQRFVDRFREFDVGICGEGEILFPRVVRDILDGKKTERVYGPCPPNDLDALPFPAWDAIRIRDYFTRAKPVPTLLTMRGCYYRCVFCSVPAGTPVRYRCRNGVIEDIRRICSLLKNDTFQVVDDTFTLNRKHAWEVCEGILQMKFPIRWVCQTRADLVDRELVRAMADAGCYRIWFGIESGDERCRSAALGKAITDEHIRSAVSWCKRYRVEAGGYFITGLPGETPAGLKMTERFPARYDLDEVTVGLAIVFPGTPLNKENMKLGKSDIALAWDRYANSSTPVKEHDIFYLPADMTRRRLEAVNSWMHIWLFLSPWHVFCRIVKDCKSAERLHNDAIFCWNILRSRWRRIVNVLLFPVRVMYARYQ